MLPLAWSAAVCYEDLTYLGAAKILDRRDMSKLWAGGVEVVLQVGCPKFQQAVLEGLRPDNKNYSPVYTELDSRGLLYPVIYVTYDVLILLPGTVGIYIA